MFSHSVPLLAGLPASGGYRHSVIAEIDWRVGDLDFPSCQARPVGGWQELRELGQLSCLEEWAILFPHVICSCCHFCRCCVVCARAVPIMLTCPRDPGLTCLFVVTSSNQSLLEIALLYQLSRRIAYWISRTWSCLFLTHSPPDPIHPPHVWKEGGGGTKRSRRTNNYGFESSKMSYRLWLPKLIEENQENALFGYKNMVQYIKIRKRKKKVARLWANNLLSPTGRNYRARKEKLNADIWATDYPLIHSDWPIHRMGKPIVLCALLDFEIGKITGGTFTVNWITKIWVKGVSIWLPALGSWGTQHTFFFSFPLFSPSATPPSNE